MPTPRTPEEVIGKLQNLPAAQLRDFLAALASGDLEGARKAGGGLTRSQLADLQPSGESGLLLDGLEQQTIFQLLRKARLSLLAALPGAVLTLATISTSFACEGDAEAAMDASDIPLVDPQLPTHEQEQVQRKLMSAIAKSRVPIAKNLSEKRAAALSLFDLAEKLAVLSLAQEYREPDRAADEQAEIQRLAAEQGIDLPGLGEPERRLRSIK